MLVAYSMSYDIQLFRAETKNKEQQANDDEFFDNEENLQPFTPEQYQSLKEQLIDYGYETVTDNPEQSEYKHSNYNITALLTDRGLYFAAGFNEDAMFEAGMTASELTDTGEFVKYDPQAGGWEEF